MTEKEKPKKRPEEVSGVTVCKKTNCGNLFITMNELDGKPFEVFVEMGKNGSCSAVWNNVLWRTITYHLRKGDDVKTLIKEYGVDKNGKKTWCHGSSHVGVTCADAVAEALQEWLDGKLKSE